jgi:hypothetical protein
MREDRRNGSPISFFTRRLSPPSPRIKARKDHLIHPIIARIGFEQGYRESQQAPLVIAVPRFGVPYKLRHL